MMEYIHVENLGDIPRKRRKPPSLCKDYYAKRTKAIKEHKCYECEQLIEKGEMYTESRYMVGKYYKIRRFHHWCFKWMRTVNELLGTTAIHEEIPLAKLIRIFGEVEILEEAPIFVQQWFRARKKDEFIPEQPMFTYYKKARPGPPLPQTHYEAGEY